MENLHFMGHKVAPSCANCVSQFLRELYHDPLFGTFLFHSQVCRQGRSTTRCNNVEFKARKFFQHLMELWCITKYRLQPLAGLRLGLEFLHVYIWSPDDGQGKKKVSVHLLRSP